MMASRASKKSKKTRTKRGATAADFDHERTRFVMYNVLPQFPDEYDTVITSGFTIDNAGATASVTGYILPNSLLVSSASGATVAQSGYADDVFKMYEAYRVVAYEMEYQWVSRNSVDANWCLIHTNEDPQLGTAGFSLLTLTYANKYHLLVPGTGKSPCSGKSRTPKIWLADLVGSEVYETDTSYAGAIEFGGTFTSPANPVYAAYSSGLITGSFAASSSPYIVGVLKQWVKIYSRRL